MSVSALFGTKMPTISHPLPLSSSSGAATTKPLRFTTSPAIESSSRPQKKATAHHRKTRPRKSQPWDIRRGPTVYPPLPALPPEWSFAPADDAAVTPTTTTE